MSKHILIVEDEKDLLDTLEYNFKNAGYKVSTTLEGNKAISLATGKNNPDLVVLDLMLPDISGLEDKLVKVKMEAGDLLIFNSSQPHGIRPNNSEDKVRIAQYLSMMPAQEDEQDLVNWRINSWKNRIAPEGHAFPGDPRKKEQTHYDKANLSVLGEKLLGLKKW